MMCLLRKMSCSRCLRGGDFQFWRNVIFLYTTTLFIALPVICYNLRHTILDNMFHRNETLEKYKMIEENSARLNRSSEILQNAQANFKNGNSIFYRHLFQESQTASVSFGKKKLPESPGKKVGLAISIITVSRNRHTLENYEPKYLSQTLATFIELLKKTESDGSFNIDFHLSICNVDADPDNYAEVQTLPEWIPVFKRFPIMGGFSQKHLSYDALLNKEKEDYVYCLDKALNLNLSYVLLVEDDALPLSDLFPVIDSLVLNPKSFGSNYNKMLESATFFKLYHPERLIGYVSIEPERIPELLSLGVLMSAILVLLYIKYVAKKSVSLKLVWFTFFVYSTLVIFTVGRSNIIEFRRLSRYLYQTTPAPSCCTPAILFPRKGGKTISDYLKTVQCRAKFAKDMAIDKLKTNKNLVTKLIQPNLFKHIGQFSSLRTGLVNPFIV